MYKKGLGGLKKQGTTKGRNNSMENANNYIINAEIKNSEINGGKATKKEKKDTQYQVNQKY